MNAFELFNEHGNPCGVWCCGNCRKLVLSPVWSPDSTEPKSTREAAEKCCTPKLCKCGKEAETYGHECGKCRSERWSQEQHQRHAKRLLAAEDVTGTYNGPVYVEFSNGGDMGEGYYSSVELVVEDAECAEEESPQWAFACRAEVRGLNIDGALEQVCDDGYEGMGDNLEIPKSLRDEVDKFNKENESRLTCYEVDYKRKVKVK